MQDITKTLRDLQDNGKYISIIFIDEMINKDSIQTHIEVYNFIYKSIIDMMLYKRTCLNQDKRSRVANIIAVKWTHGIHFRLQSIRGRLKILKEVNNGKI